MYCQLKASTGGTCNSGAWGEYENVGDGVRWCECIKEDLLLSMDMTTLRWAGMDIVDSTPWDGAVRSWTRSKSNITRDDECDRLPSQQFLNNLDIAFKALFVILRMVLFLEQNILVAEGEITSVDTDS